MRPLRILYSEAATGFGGQEQYIFRMMRALRDRGHHLEAVCQPHAQLTRHLRESGFTVHTLHTDGPRNYLSGVIRVRRLLKAGRFDVLNTNSRRDTLLAGVAGRLAGTPLIVRTRHLAKRVGSLLSYTRVPHRVCVSSEFVRQLVLAQGVDEAFVQVVYPCLADGFCGARPTGVLRRELRLGDGDLLVGCVAVLRTEKGHRDLIAALEPLFQEDARVHLVLVGGGSPGFEDLSALVKERGLAHRVHLLGARSDVALLMPDLDVFALATRMEAAGMVFAEAGAAGVPVVGTRVGGVPEMLDEGRSGVLVPVGDVAALREALRSLIKDPGLRQRMGEAGREFCCGTGRFEAGAMADRMESVYREWLRQLGWKEGA
ncbi:Glycosyltransferase involved in cell wall biosynthesis OS=Castellaniella defragrans OX=75697 GN=HNR28_003128 PE=4 SV=1 [Castellaniella defragrans]